MYTLEKDFNEKKYYAKEITAGGYNYDINYSSILTKLIQECGRLCESYASDLFIDWNTISEEIKNKTMTTSTYLFGIRENGVDHAAFVLARYENNKKNAYYEYRKIYRLDVVVENDEITMKLAEIQKPFSERRAD